VDEVSYGAEHTFLTCVANHDSGGIVWATEGRNANSLQAFFDQLTDEQKASIRAVSIDMSAGYEKAIRAENGFRTRRWCSTVPRLPARLQGDRPGPPWRVQPARPLRHRHRQMDQGRALQPAQGPHQADHQQLLKLAEVQQTNQRMFRAALLYGELRYVYKVPKHQAPERLDAWLAWASDRG